MWSIKKILVPTDFSRASEAALLAAIDLAKKYEASIVLMHAYQVPVYTYPSAPLVPLGELSMQVENAALKSLDAAAVAHGAGIPIMTALYVGVAWEQILKAANEHEVGLIVMGSRGLRGLPRALMGSTAERVVRYASTAVMTLHGPPESSPPSRMIDDNAQSSHGTLDQWLV
jgi:nucleotide-binding universal stress UspA family protein